MDIEDKYNAVAKDAQRMLREEEDKTVFDDDTEVYVEDDAWWASSY